MGANVLNKRFVKKKEDGNYIHNVDRRYIFLSLVNPATISPKVSPLHYHKITRRSISRFVQAIPDIHIYLAIFGITFLRDGINGINRFADNTTWRN
jgi:hypothetical protein